MSVRSIDIQQVIAKTDDVQRMLQTQQQQPQHEQQQFATKLLHEQEVKQKQTQPSPKPEEAKIREEGKHSRQRRYLAAKHKKKSKEEVIEDKEHLIDIKA